MLPVWRLRPPLLSRALHPTRGVYFSRALSRRHEPQDPMRGPNARVENPSGSPPPASTSTSSTDSSANSSSNSSSSSSSNSSSSKENSVPSGSNTGKSGPSPPSPRPSPSSGPSSGPSSAPSPSPSGPYGAGPPPSPSPSPHPPTFTPPLPPTPPPPHPFDTHAFVSRLEAAELPSAKELVDGVRYLITSRGGSARARMLSVSERDNDAYHFKAALSTLRAEQTSRARQDGMTMRAASAATQREVDALSQKMREDITLMRHDVDMDMDSRKSDTRAELKRYEIAVQELNNKFTINLSDLRTELESAKWDATRRAIAIIAVLVVGGVVLSTISVGNGNAVPPPPKTYVDAGVGDDDGHGDGQGHGKGQGHGHSTEALDEIIGRMKADMERKV